jgi:hypothetical protein
VADMIRDAFRYQRHRGYQHSGRLQSGRRVILNKTRRARSVHEQYYNTLRETLRKNTITEKRSSSRPTNRSWTSRSTTARSPPPPFRNRTSVKANDVAMQGTCQTGEEERDASYALKTNEHGVIDKIIAQRGRK